MNKKRVFGVVAFIVIGLFMFTFANPNQEVKDSKKSKKGKEEKTPKVEVIEAKEDVIEPVDNVIPQNVVLEGVEAIVENIDLDALRTAAIDEIKNYRKDYVYSDTKLYEQLIDNYTDSINKSTTEADINRLVDNAKDAIDKLIDADMKAYKDAAKDEIDRYAGEVLELPHEKEIANIKTKIDESTTKEKVDEEVNAGKELIDNLQALDLKNAKESAINDIKNYTDYEFLDTNIETYNGIIDETVTNITDATTIAKVKEALETGKGKIDDLIKKDKAEVEALRKKLSDLVNADYSAYKDTKTTNTYNDLIKEVEAGKQLTAESNIKDVIKAISNIETAIKNLVDLKVTAVTATLDKTEYIVGETPVPTVKVTYNDEVRNQGDTTVTDYETLSALDTTTVATSRTFKVKYAGIEASADYSVIYSNEQMAAKVAKISPTIDWHIEYDYVKIPFVGKVKYPVGIGFTIEFRNADQDVEATFIHKETDNIFTNKDRVIDLNKTDNKDVFDIDYTDYKRLWSNNTLFANEHVFVTYKIGNQYYTQRYMEKNNVLYRD